MTKSDGGAALEADQDVPDAAPARSRLSAGWKCLQDRTWSSPLLLLEQRHVLRRSFAVQAEVNGHPQCDPEEDGPLRNVAEFLRIIRQERESL